MDLLERLHLGKWKPPPEIVRRRMPLDGFIFLGAEGQPAVPALIELLNDKDGDVRSCAASCLGFIGPAAVEAVPALLQHLTDPDPSVCINSETSLGLIHGRPELVIPALTERLRRKDEWQWHTLSALGWFGPDAKAAVPVILPLLNDQDQETRNRAAIVLKRIDPEAAASAEAKSP
jgi:HEAT repeat protein